MGISKSLGMQILGSLVAFNGIDCYEALYDIVCLPCGVFVQEIQSFFIRQNTGFNDGLKGYHEYGVIEVIAIEGWWFLNWEETNPLLLRD